MLLKCAYDWGGNSRAYTLEQAVARECYSDRDGIAESAAASAEKTGEFLGKLIEVLAEKGVLNLSDIKTLLPAYKEVAA